MARDFDGVNDRLDLGTDPSIDDFVTQSLALWAERDIAATAHHLLGKQNFAAAWQLIVSAGDRPLFSRDWLLANGEWRGPVLSPTTGLHHLAVVYDGGAAANDPTVYVDGAAVTLIEDVAPSGTLESDAALSLLAGEDGAGGRDLDGAVGWLCYANALWDAAQVNRARWWGTPGGALAVYHPLVTDKLKNEGTATADATATGTAGRGIPRVERCWGALMGCGR